MRVKPQKPTTSTSRVINQSQHEQSITSLKPISKDSLQPKSKLSNIPSSSSNNVNSFLPLLPKSPVSISFVSTAISSAENTTTKNGANSLTITPTVIYSNRATPANGNKRKRSVKSLDSNSEVTTQNLTIIEIQRQ